RPAVSPAPVAIPAASAPRATARRCGSSSGSNFMPMAWRYSSGSAMPPARRSAPRWPIPGIASRDAPTRPGRTMHGRVPVIYLRHVSREIALQTLLVGVVLLAVLAVYQFSFVLGRAADGQIEGDT